MDIQDLLRRYPTISITDTVVEEVVGSVPVTEYKVHLTGAAEGSAVDFTYITSAAETDINHTDAETRESRYAALVAQASNQKAITAEVKSQIDVLSPPPPDPIPGTGP